MMRRLVIALFCCAVACCAAASAEELPTLAALQAKMDAAIGKRPPSTDETIAYTISGVAGSQRIIRSGDDEREIDLDGPFHTESGQYHSQRWYQNANGQTVLEQRDPGRAAEDTYTTTVSRTSVPVDAFVVSRLNRAGSGTREYIEPATYHVVRRERVRPTETTVTAYDDFRTLDGYTVAYHWTHRDGHVENDADFRIGAFTAGPVADADVRIPKPRRAVVEFPVGATQVALPVRLVGNKFIVRIVVAGRGLDFELDTGAGGIFLERNVARQLGLHTILERSNAMNAGRFSQGTTIVPEMQIGDLRMHDVVIGTMPELNETVDDVKAVGLLGFDFIAGLTLRLDYEHATVTASPSADVPVVPAEPAFSALNIRLGTGVPLTDVTINGALGERFAIDTGAAVPLLINDYFARRNPQALVDRGQGPGRNARLTGVGGAIDYRPYQLAEVRVGNLRFADFVGYRIMERTSYETDADGFIGAPLLRFFTMYLDYANSQVILVRNSVQR